MESLHTERLDLVPAHMEDVAALHALWTEPGVRRYLWDDVIIDRQQAEEVVRTLIDSPARGVALWTIRDRGGRRLIGFCALREIAGTQNVELLYGLTESAWGRGLASEAARAVLRHGFETGGLARIWARTDPPNLASQRVIASLGMQPADDPGDTPQPTLAYVIEREQFRYAPITRD